MDHSPYIPLAKAQFLLNICSRCVVCRLIIYMHTQEDLQTAWIPIDRGLPSFERADTDHDTVPGLPL